MLSRLTYAKITSVASYPYMEYTNTYDAAGNLTDYIYDQGSGDVSKTYSFNGDLVIGDSNGKIVNWDDNGRQTCRLSTAPANYSLTYDWEGRLRKGLVLGATNRMEAKYTPDGVRVTKKRIVGSSTTYNYKYIVDISSSVPAILLILDANSGSTLRTYIHANGQVLAQHSGSYTAPRYFYLHERLGSVRQIINSSGSVVNHYTYDPWGLPVSGETQEGVSNLYRFAGYVYDAEILQYNCFRRQYDPVLWRFTSRDPVAGNYQEPMSLHRYLYCNNDAINRKDPTGELWGALERAEELTDSMNGYNVAADLSLGMGSDWGDILDISVGINAAREGFFGGFADRYHTRSGSISEMFEYMISPEDVRAPVKWECPATEGFYRHCVSACRLNGITGNPVVTMIGALEAGNDWPSSDWTTNNMSDVVADFAGIIASYITPAPGAGCRTLCEPMSKGMSKQLCK